MPIEEPLIVNLELQIKVRNAECRKIIQDFPQDQVAAMHLLLLYNLEVNRHIFGCTLQESAKHLRLLQALNDGSDYAILCERTWRQTLRFVDEVFLVPELERDGVTVIFRVDKMLGEQCGSEQSSDRNMDNFRIFADQLMNALISKMKGVEGHMHAGSGWMQLSRAFVIDEFKQSKTAFESPVEHQVKCMRSMLTSFNEASGTHWRCARIHLGQEEQCTTDNPMLAKKRHQQWENFVELNSSG